MSLLHAYNFYTGLITAVLPAVTNAYTVPAGKRIIVRQVEWRNNSGAVAIVAYFRNSGILLHSVSLAAGGNGAWSTWLVMMPGDVIQLACNNAVGANVSVSGSIYNI